MKELAEQYRSELIEAVAENDEELMMKYLDGEELTKDEIKTALRKETIANTIVPVTCGTSYNNKGVQKLLDAIVDYMPAPTDIEDIKGINPDTGEEEVRESSDNAPFAALAFKIATDPFVGKLCFFRVYSGIAKAGTTGYNSVKDTNERIGRILQMHANHRQDIDDLLRRRHRRRCGPEEHHHRRHPVRREASHHSGEHGVPRACYPRCHRAQDQGRSGEDGHCAGQAG